MQSTSEPRVHELVETLGEKHSLTILEECLGEARDARTIIETCDVPRTTFYRRVDALEELGLIEEHGEVDLEGSHRTTYRSNVDEIRITVEDDRFVAAVEHRVSPSEHWQQAWETIRGSTD